MVAHVQHVAEDEIAHGAALEAYLFGLDHLDEAGMVRQVEAVADPLGAKKHCIIKFLIATGVALARMQIQIKSASKFHRLALSFVDDGQELAYAWRSVFLLHKVKTDDHVGVFC